MVYDSVGKDTFEKSLDCLAEWGFLVNFGNASGPAPDIAPLTLMAKGSLYLNRPTLFNYTNDHGRRLAAASDLFGVVAAGNVSIEINQTYPLSDTARAHIDWRRARPPARRCCCHRRGRDIPPTLDARLSPAVSTSPSRGEVIRSAYSLPPTRGRVREGGRLTGGRS